MNKKRKLSELKKLPWNPRICKGDKFQKLVASLKKFWFIEGRPMLLSNRTWELIILWWNQRYEACIKLGIEEVPTFLFENLTKEEEEEITIRDNVNNWDWDTSTLRLEWDLWKLDERGVDIKEKKDDNEVPEVEFTTELLEENNYLTVVFDNEVDWLNLKSLYPLSTVKALDSKEWFDKKWVGRVVKWEDFIDKVKDNLWI